LGKVTFKVHKSGFFAEGEDLTKMVDKTVELSEANEERFSRLPESDKETVYDSWRYTGSRLTFDEWLTTQWDESAKLFRLPASRVQADLLIQDKQGRVIAVVELKNRLQFSPQLAAELRRNMIVHGLGELKPYFLILSQDKGYLWKPNDSVNAMPSYSFSTSSIFPSNISELIGSRRLPERELEFFVLQWLTELTKRPVQVGAHENELARSGFLDAIRDAVILTEAQL
jgi:hypothetical protein